MREQDLEQFFISARAEEGKYKMMTYKPMKKSQQNQIVQLGISVIKEVLEELDLDEKSAQRILDGGVGEFKKTMRPPVFKNLKSLSMCQRFKDEETITKGTYTYKPKGLNIQHEQLQVLFPGLGSYNQEMSKRIEDGKIKLPKCAEGWFLIPNWRKCPQIFGSTYSEALLKVLEVTSKTKKEEIFDERKDNIKVSIDEKSLCQSDRTKEFWEKLSKDQSNPDVLIVAAQFGIRHRGRSVRRAEATFFENEFHLGTFAICIMLLTHPKRLGEKINLGIFCGGDYCPWNDFSGVFFFNPWSHSHLVWKPDSHSNNWSSSPSGFSPQ